ncbi:MAG TPA: HIT domain-containing protein, partial [Thermodesulfobacteriota bacterium]|nr:HIT domain-containing protein [Thermodesulfobacteriota bacterium]
MKHLWAPWRIEYITKVRPGGCIFCNAAKARPDKSPDESPDESDDEFQDKSDESLTLFNGRHTLVMLNKYPYNNGHLLVAPKRHVADIEGLSAAESLDIQKLLSRS